MFRWLYTLYTPQAGMLDRSRILNRTQGMDYYDVIIRRVSDGAERVYRMYDQWPEPDEANPQDYDPWFWWTDSNGACDCNRGNFFAVAGDESDDTEHDCGETAYLVVKAILPDGREISGPDASL
jgi:hypothetical protein